MTNNLLIEIVFVGVVFIAVSAWVLTLKLINHFDN
jgi:hypothetical protein